MNQFFNQTDQWSLYQSINQSINQSNNRNYQSIKLPNRHATSLAFNRQSSNQWRFARWSKFVPIATRLHAQVRSFNSGFQTCAQFSLCRRTLNEGQSTPDGTAMYNLPPVIANHVKHTDIRHPSLFIWAVRNLPGERHQSYFVLVRNIQGCFSVFFCDNTNSQNAIQSLERRREKPIRDIQKKQTSRHAPRKNARPRR